MVDIVTFDPEQHLPPWETFIVSSYQNPNYVLLSLDYLRWQFFDNPANDTGGYTLWLVIHRDEVVAQLGYVPFNGISPDGGRFAGAYPINLIVSPEYRSAGLGAIMLNRLLKQTPCVLNPGSSEAGAALCIGFGMHDLAILRRYIAVTDAEAARALAADGRLPTGLREFEVGRSPSRAGAVTRLPEGSSAFSFPVPVYGAERSLEFMRWRYENHPGFDYEFLVSENLKERSGVSRGAGKRNGHPRHPRRRFPGCCTRAGCAPRPAVADRPGARRRSSSTSSAAWTATTMR